MPERVAFTKRSLKRGISRGHEHLSRDAREDLPVPLGICAHGGGSAVAREEIPVQLGNCAHDGGTPSRVSLLQRLRVRRPSREEQEGDQRTKPRRGPRGPFAGEGRASRGSGDAMQMTAREGVASRGGSPPMLPGPGDQHRFGQGGRHAPRDVDDQATHCTGWFSKVDCLGCTGARPVPSLRVRRRLE